MDPKEILIIYLGLMNIITFITYGRDKCLAINKQWRIPERTLLLLSLFGGSLGAALGMAIFRHKTNHIKFMIIVPLSLLIWAYIVLKFY